MSFQTIPFVISIALEKRSLFHLQISLWQHYFAFLLLFFRKVSFSFFLLPIFFIKTAKPKSETSFSKLLKGYAWYLFLIKAFKVKKFPKIYTLKKIKEFIDCDGLHMLYQTINRPLKYIFVLC